MTAVPQSEPKGVDDGYASDVSTRDRLLVAAYELLIINGYQATTLQAVARRAGLTTGAIYAHFGGKQELMAHAVLDEWYRTDRETLNEYLAAHVDSDDRRGAMSADQAGDAGVDRVDRGDLRPQVERVDLGCA